MAEQPFSKPRLLTLTPMGRAGTLLTKAPDACLLTVHAPTTDGVLLQQKPLMLVCSLFTLLPQTVYSSNKSP